MQCYHNSCEKIYIGWGILKNPVKCLNISCLVTKMTLGFWRGKLQNKEKAFSKFWWSHFP